MYVKKQTNSYLFSNVKGSSVQMRVAPFIQCNVCVPTQFTAVYTCHKAGFIIPEANTNCCKCTGVYRLMKMWPSTTINKQLLLSHREMSALCVICGTSTEEHTLPHATNYPI